MAGTIGRAFKISAKDVKGYGYAKPSPHAKSYRKNAGVTAIAAINGRGSYRARKPSATKAPSARAVMQGLRQNERRATAKQLTESERDAFARRVQQSKRRTTMLRKNMSRSAAGKKNIRAAQSARKAWGRYVAPGTRVRVGPSSAWGHKSLDYRAPIAESYRGKLDPGVYTANRRKKTARKQRRNGRSAAQRLAAMKNLRKARAARAGLRRNPTRRPRRAAARRPVARRRMATNRRLVTARKRPVRRLAANRRRVTRRIRRNGQTAAQRRASLKNLRKARTRLRANGRRRVTRKASARKTVRRLRPNRRRVTRRLRRNGQTAAQRRASLRNLRKARTTRLRANGRRRVTRKLRRNKTRRPARRLRRNGRQTLAQRRASLRNLRKARSARLSPNRRRRSTRSLRRNKRTSRRRGMRRNGRKSFLGKLFRKNGMFGDVQTVLLSGVKIGAGFLGHKLASRLFTTYVLDQFILPAVAPVATPAATSGLEFLYPYRNLISSLVTGGIGLYATQKLVKDNQTKMLIAGGIATSVVQTGLVAILEAVGQGNVAGYLAGADPTAARLSAMYGFGGTSIMPNYAPIGQLPPYEASAGMGEFFESGVEGLGNYINNPEMMQAAAGMGASVEYNGNHVDPSSDLDQQLSIMEAAAGVGQSFEAAAGMGEYLAASGMGEYFDSGVAGLGDVSTVPGANTWIPGTTNPQLWAGVRSVSRPQSATAMIPAGVLSTPGGAGILG